MAMFIEEDTQLHAASRILHLAPELGLANMFFEIAGDNCTFVDLDIDRFKHIPNMQTMDLCSDLDDIDADSFDLIVHSHVMEHLPCNYAYVLFQLHRILKPGGRVICSIPFLGGYFDESSSPKLTDEDRVKRFGQDDHVRRFGTADLQMSLGKVYPLVDDYDITARFSRAALLAANVPEYTWFGYSPHSALSLGKDDYLL